MNEQKLYDTYTKAREDAWKIHDELVRRGLNLRQITIHPSYLFAVQQERQAYREWLAARGQLNG